MTAGRHEDVPLVQLNGASFGYGGAPVVVDASLALRPGVWVEVEGSNGSGKTTLLRGAIGLLAPASGSARVITDRIGYVPQVRGLNPLLPLTAREVVAQGLVRRNRTGRKRAEERAAATRKVNAILSDVGLTSAAGSAFNELSGGQQQRVLIARALVGEPELLALDEPWNGIDREHVRSIAAFVAGRAREAGIGVLCISHGVEDREDLVDMTIRVEAGKLHAQESG